MVWYHAFWIACTLNTFSLCMYFMEGKFLKLNEIGKIQGKTCILQVSWLSKEWMPQDGSAWNGVYVAFLNSYAAVWDLLYCLTVHLPFLWDSYGNEKKSVKSENISSSGKQMISYKSRLFIASPIIYIFLSITQVQRHHNRVMLLAAVRTTTVPYIDRCVLQLGGGGLFSCGDSS